MKKIKSWAFVGFAIGLLATIALSAPGDRIIRNKNLDKDVSFCVNDGGVDTCSLSVLGPTGNIYADGKLGIRESSPNYQIDVLSPSGDGNMLRLSREGGTNATMNLGTFFTMFYEGSAFLQADSSSNVNILNGGLTVSEGITATNNITTTSGTVTGVAGSFENLYGALSVSGNTLSVGDAARDITIPSPAASKNAVFLVSGQFSNGANYSSYTWIVNVISNGTSLAVTTLSSNVQGSSGSVSITRPNATTLRIGGNNNAAIRTVRAMRLVN